MKSLSRHSKRIGTLYWMVQVVHHKLISRQCRYPVRSSRLRNKMFGELTQGSKIGKSSSHPFLTPPFIIIRCTIHLHVVQMNQVRSFHSEMLSFLYRGYKTVPTIAI